MAHRGDRERGAGREWERSERDDRPRREREPREPNRDRDRERERDYDRPDRDIPRGGGLNEFFVDGEGIHREVMQREICKWLGAEAYSRPGTYNGTSGYIVTAVRPFTQKMIDDLQALSREYIAENRDLSRRGFEGVSYPQSQTSRDYDRSRQNNMMNSPEIYNDQRYNQPQPPYSSAGVQPGYMSAASSYTQGSNFQSPPIHGFESTAPGYQTTGFPVGSNFVQSSNYPPTSMYPPASGYTTTGYTAISGRPGNTNEPNYTWNTPGNYADPNHQYRQPNQFPSGTRSGEPLNDPTRVGPRSQQPYNLPGENPLRGFSNFDPYTQPMAPGQPSRGGFVGSRGTATTYEGQPLDGGHTLEGRRR